MNEKQALNLAERIAKNSNYGANTNLVNYLIEEDDVKQTTVRFNEETLRQMNQLAEWVNLPTNTDVLRYSVAMAVNIESARRSLSDSDFVGFLAELYRPI